jgi:glycerophosphoryl diester phosphodiesterase
MEFIRMTTRKFQLSGLGLATVLLAANTSLAQTAEPAQTVGLGQWSTDPVFTIGETFNGYTPPGIPDGMGAFERDYIVEIVSNHELSSGVGYPYTLDSGVSLTGARVSKLVFDKETRELIAMGPAYDTIYNRAGNMVDLWNGLDTVSTSGLNRLCSAGSFVAGQAGFVDDIFLTGEETGGGTEFALDVANGELWAAPWMGLAAWESVAALEIPGFNNTHVAVLVGDDRGDAALLLYVGEKIPGGNFLERNGLANGKLYMWVADSGDLSPADFNGTGEMRRGKFVEVENYNDTGADGFDDLGFATQAKLDEQKAEIGAFNFSRPEDLHTNPKPGKGNEVIFASTGRFTALNQGKDLWGTTYLIDVKINPGRIRTDNITADITIVYDGDDLDKQDFGIRSPDNLVCADDGFVYIQEDRSIGGFGAVSFEETSVWKLDPQTSMVTRVAQVDRTAVPAGQTDIDPDDLGNWETSGIIDVTDEFDAEGERLLFFNVQAHSLRGGPIGDWTVPSSDPNSDDKNLVQGGQFLFLSKPEGKPGKAKGSRR